MSRYIIHKVLNNNIVLCKVLENNEECMLLGKGIGFQKNRGDEIDKVFIEKLYFLHDEKNITRYQQLVEQCDENLVQVVEDVIRKMETRFGNTYDEYLHIALLDHLNFAIYRYHNKIDVKNIFLEEYSVMYAEEYAFAQEMLTYINQCLQITLPHSEIGFITLHIHSAIHQESVSKSALYMQIITACVNRIETKLHMHLDSYGIERMRLITHLKFALERADQQIKLDNPVLASLKETYPKTYALAQELGSMIEADFAVQLDEGELGYLALHIQNIIMALAKKGVIINGNT